MDKKCEDTVAAKPAPLTESERLQLLEAKVKELEQRPNCIVSVPIPVPYPYPVYPYWHTYYHYNPYWNQPYAYTCGYGSLGGSSCVSVSSQNCQSSLSVGSQSACSNQAQGLSVNGQFTVTGSYP
jgi:hypothetical protein